MLHSSTQLIARQVLFTRLKSKSTLYLILIFNLFQILALYTEFKVRFNDQQTVQEYKKEVRKRWESNPDKHPHRMAHYGYLVFREKHPLSFFDPGINNYLGNLIFLEAHRQNTANFSEASFSSGLLRFGYISAAMILQILVPLLLFFWGFSLVSNDREKGTLKIIFTQGIQWRQFLWGKIWGLYALALTVFLPAVVFTLLLILSNHSANTQTIIRYLLLILSYSLYFLMACILAVYISARSKSSKNSLVTLIGIWLTFTLVLPKVATVYGQTQYPAPSKVAFDTEVEKELLKLGDNHNPDDPHYKGIKDSVLAAHKVSSTDQLPFNYSGFIMKEGEKLSTQAYLLHEKRLVNIYRKQSNAFRLTGLINPVVAIKQFSMALTGADYATYRDFLGQAEAYRYKLAQTMNDLQIKFISNNKKAPDGKHILDHSHWADFPDFDYQFLSFSRALSYEYWSVIAILCWLVGLSLFIHNSKNLKVI